MQRVKFMRNTVSVPNASQPTPNSTGQRKAVRRWAACAFILLLSAAAAYPVSLRLISQIYYQRTKNFIRQGHYGLASLAIKKAAFYQPKDYHIQRQWGDIIHNLAKLNSTAQGAYGLAFKAKARYQEALRLNPLDAQSVYELAREEDWLEQLYTKIRPGKNDNSHDALSYFQRAIRLRPNGILYHYALARCLYRHSNQAEILPVVRKLVQIYPQAYYHLRKEEFWSLPVEAACRQGLQEAIKDKISSAEALMALSNMAVQEKDWTTAIDHFQQALQIQPLKKTEEAYFHLGQWFLKTGDAQAARDSFLKSLSLSRTRDKQMASLYRVFKNEEALVEFNDFYQEAKQRFTFSAQSGIFLARSFIDLKQYDQARRIIEELNTDYPTAEAYYWLARIAENEADWDQMELAIQRATVLEPENNHYRRIFLRLLKKLKKFETAEIQLDIIIDHSNRPAPELYNEKAWFRWQQKDYDGALEAWQSAIRLKSDSAAYHAQAAEAYLMLGDWSKAGAFYQKATILAPQNERYTKRYREIMGDDAAEG